MNTQTFTAERLNVYRRDDLYTAAADARATRVSIGGNGPRPGKLTGHVVAMSKRLASALRISGQKAPATAGR